MFLINRHDKVVEIPDDQAELYKQKLKSGTMREATDSEIAAYYAVRELSGSTDGTVYYSTVDARPDGYGMSRDHIKRELFEQGVRLNERAADQKVGLLYNYPYSLPAMKNDVKLIYTMFESDKIPEDWPDYLAMADEVLVPSKFCQDTFARSGVKTTVVPLGYNDRVFSFIERPLPAGSDQPFTFIHYDSFNLRKGFAEVFNAFTAEFKPAESAKLIIKTVRDHPPIPIIPAQYPNIEVIRGTVPESELTEILGRSHCMIYPSRGEGFGITPLEAMATGLPAIIPNAHGISEYFNASYMLELKVKGKTPALYNRFKGQDVGSMVECDVDDLRRQMRWAFDNQQAALELGRSASEYVKSFTYRHTAERLATIIRKWENADVLRRGEGKYLMVEAV